jgi:hypothetical protein
VKCLREIEKELDSEIEDLMKKKIAIKEQMVKMLRDI